MVCFKYEQVVDVIFIFFNSSRPAQDTTGPVSDKDSSVHRPSKLKVPGGLAYCQGDEGLLKTQVRQCLTEVWKSPGTSTGTDSLTNYATSHFPFWSQPRAEDCFLQPCVMFLCHLIWKYSQAICHGH